MHNRAHTIYLFDLFHDVEVALLALAVQRHGGTLDLVLLEGEPLHLSLVHIELLVRVLDNLLELVRLGEVGFEVHLDEFLVRLELVHELLDVVGDPEVLLDGLDLAIDLALAVSSVLVCGTPMEIEKYLASATRPGRSYRASR